jgi:hypothetical protein
LSKPLNEKALLSTLMELTGYAPPALAGGPED